MLTISIFQAKKQWTSVSDDNSISDTGNNLETQVCPRTSQLPWRHVPIDHGIQNNQFHLSKETNMNEHSAVTMETFLDNNTLSNDQKKRKIQGLYYGTSSKPEEKYEVQKVRKIDRESILVQKKKGK